MSILSLSLYALVLMFLPSSADDVSDPCPVENGYCVTASNQDQNSGVIQINSVDGDTEDAQMTCLAACHAHDGATGCEVIWDQGNRGCYVMTADVDHGNNVDRHLCWVFSKCATTAIPTTSTTADPLTTADANCASLPIDAYLTSCSDEFAANELHIEALQSAQTAMTDRLDAAEETITANVEQNAADLDAVEATLQGVESDLAAAKVDISANGERVDEVVSAADAVEETIELLEERLADVEAWKETVITFSSARATPGVADQGMAVGAYDYGGAMSFANKDIIIAVLVVANVVLIIGLLCREYGTQRRVKYAKVYASEN